MDLVCCLMGFYLYLQVAIIFNSWKLLKWDDPKWAWAHKNDKPGNLRSFCLAWLFITPLAMFVDVAILVTAGQTLITGEWVRIINALPFLLILAASTYAKTWRSAGDERGIAALMVLLAAVMRRARVRRPVRARSTHAIDLDSTRPSLLPADRRSLRPSKLHRW